MFIVISVVKDVYQFCHWLKDLVTFNVRQYTANCTARRFSILNIHKTQAELLLMEHLMCFLLLYFYISLIYLIFMLLWPHGRWVNSKDCSLTVGFCFYLKRDFHSRYLMNILGKMYCLAGTLYLIYYILWREFALIPRYSLSNKFTSCDAT